MDVGDQNGYQYRKVVTNTFHLQDPPQTSMLPQFSHHRVTLTRYKSWGRNYKKLLSHQSRTTEYWTTYKNGIFIRRKIQSQG